MLTNKINLIVTDFDGVLTNNKVTIDTKNNEHYTFDKSDSLAISYIINQTNINFFILTSETNPVYLLRSKKLKIKIYSGIKNKLLFLENFYKKNNKFNFQNTIYFGNDLNDYKAMSKCGIKVCPKDSHRSILKIADYKSKKNGGDGVIRDFIEHKFKLFSKYHLNY